MEHPLHGILRRCLGRESLPAVVGDDGRVDFAPTLGLDGATVGSFFAASLADHGVPADALQRPCPAAAIASLGVRLERSVAETRKRVVADGAFTSGALPVPFADVPEPMRLRGLAVYRFPSRSRARIRVEPERIRIDVPRGRLGQITSVGFWLPTFVAGDFDVVLEHRLLRWRPGSGPACFGLHAADRATARTYYAQWTSEPGQPTQPGTVLGDRPLRHGLPGAELAGDLRLRREGCLVTSWYRPAGGPWQLLGQRGDDPGAPMVFGAKIWAFADCRGLLAEAGPLRVVGTVRDDGDVPPPFAADRRIRTGRAFASARQRSA